ncbi:MAG: tetratricopeptide repeat protein [Gemmatimonadetes bacterium]|jgi:tetratricopeptide (TPR) repeat protein|nr:tetratricopeptide repeat protein [Gemmatimonadota bacterium]
MKHLTLLSLLLLFACGRNDTESPSHPAPQTASIPDENKTRIRRFWQTYQEATRLRVQSAWSEAVPIYRKALELDPRHEDSLYYLGNALFETGEFTGAIDAWQTLLEVNPTSSRAHIQLGTIYSCGASGAPFDLDRAEREFTLALGLNQEETGPLLKLGEIALLKGDDARARKHLSAVDRAHARSIEARYLLGYLSWKEGDLPAAQTALQHAVEFGRSAPSSPSASSEGETRGGKPLLATGARPRSPLAPFTAALQEWDGTPVSLDRAEEEYRNLDEALRQIVHSKGSSRD